MAKFDLVFKESVSKDFRQIPRQDVQRILERLDSLRVEPRPPGSLKLSGKEYYRLRQGNSRILYEIQDTVLVVLVIKVGHRREGEIHRSNPGRSPLLGWLRHRSA